MDDSSKNLISIIEEHQQEIYRLCFYLTQNQVLAEDLTQETFLKGLEKVSQLRDPALAVPWLKSIARSLFLDNRKSARISKHHIQVENLIENSDLSFLPQTELQISALETLALLSEEDRFILVIIDLQEANYEEAALIMDCPIGTVKSRLSRARKVFSEIYDKNFGTKGKIQSSRK